MTIFFPVSLLLKRANNLFLLLFSPSLSLHRLNRTHTQMSLIESMNRETERPRKIDLYLGVIDEGTGEKKTEGISEI